MEEVEKLFKYVAEKYNIISVLEKKNIGYYKIVKGKSIQQSGKFNERLNKIVEESTTTFVYAFYVDSLHIPNFRGDLICALRIRENLLPDSLEIITQLTEMMVLHELAHLIEQQDLVGELEIVINECDLIMGLKIEKQANRYGYDINHNKNFGAILHNLIHRENDRDTATHLLRLAMSKTLIDIEDAIVNNEMDEDFYSCQD